MSLAMKLLLLGSEIRRENQLRWGEYPHDLQGFFRTIPTVVGDGILLHHQQ